MRVRVLYFAVVRERTRCTQEDLDLAAGTTAAGLLAAVGARHDAVRPLLAHLQIARNHELVAAGTVLSDGDEVALIPPVSGGAGDPPRSPPARLTPVAAIRDTPLDLMEVVRAVTHDGAGGIVTFVGVVRRASRGRTVDHLEYEAYKGMAERRLAAIADEVGRLHGGALVAILHRVGVLAVGEVAVVIAASAPHRAEAFAAARDTIERLKSEVPIWKKEVATDGEEWIGLGP